MKKLKLKFTELGSGRTRIHPHVCLNPLPSFQDPWTERKGLSAHSFRASDLRTEFLPGAVFPGVAESLVATGFQGWGRGRDQEEGGSFPSRRWQVSGVGRRQPAKLAH